MKTITLIQTALVVLVCVSGCGPSKTEPKAKGLSKLPNGQQKNVSLPAIKISPEQAIEIQEANKWVSKIAALPFPPTVHISSNLKKREATVAWRGEGIQELIEAFSQKDWKKVIAQINGGTEEWLTPTQPSAKAAQMAYESLWKKKLDLLVNTQDPLALEVFGSATDNKPSTCRVFAICLPPELSQPVSKDYEPMMNGVLVHQTPSLHPDGKGILFRERGLRAYPKTSPCSLSPLILAQLPLHLQTRS